MCWARSTPAFRNRSNRARLGDRRGPWIPAAIRVLEQSGDYPHALKVRAELVLAYLEVGDRDRADQELASLEKTFPVEQDEETLCRFGRLHREVGDDWAKATPSDRRAASAWRPALTNGPGPTMIERSSAVLVIIPESTAHRSSFCAAGPPAPDLRDTLLAERRAARDLLNRREEWPHENPEDDIWHLASAAEARLLLGEWAQSTDDFRSALSHKLAGEFHHECVGKEVRRTRPLPRSRQSPRRRKRRPAAAIPRARPEVIHPGTTGLFGASASGGQTPPMT